MDQLEGLGKAMTVGGSNLLTLLGFPDDYARLLGGHFPALRQSYYGAQVNGDASWSTVSQKGFEVYKTFVRKGEDAEYPFDV
jgi:hypothetical protein